MDQKLNENPEKVTAAVHTLKPTPMSLNGLTLQVQADTTIYLSQRNSATTEKS